MCVCVFSFAESRSCLFTEAVKCHDNCAVFAHLSPSHCWFSRGKCRSPNRWKPRLVIGATSVHPFKKEKLIENSDHVYIYIYISIKNNNVLQQSKKASHASQTATLTYSLIISHSLYLIHYTSEKSPAKLKMVHFYRIFLKISLFHKDWKWNRLAIREADEWADGLLHGNHDLSFLPLTSTVFSTREKTKTFCGSLVYTSVSTLSCGLRVYISWCCICDVECAVRYRATEGFRSVWRRADTEQNCSHEKSFVLSF